MSREWSQKSRWRSQRNQETWERKRLAMESSVSSSSSSSSKYCRQQEKRVNRKNRERKNVHKEKLGWKSRKGMSRQLSSRGFTSLSSLIPCLLYYPFIKDSRSWLWSFKEHNDETKRNQEFGKRIKRQKLWRVNEVIVKQESKMSPLPK